jgi:hypothetical protein
MILSDEEIEAVFNKAHLFTAEGFARAIEATIIKKIGEPVGVMENHQSSGLEATNMLQTVRMNRLLYNGTPLFAMPKEHKK